MRSTAAVGRVSTAARRCRGPRTPLSRAVVGEETLLGGETTRLAPEQCRPKRAAAAQGTVARTR